METAVSPSERRSAAVPESSLQLVEVLTSVLAAIDLVGEDEHPVVPVRQVPQHARDRPVLVGRCCESIVVQPVDELPEALALAVVELDVRAIVRHLCVLSSVEPLNRNPQQRRSSPHPYHFRPLGPSARSKQWYVIAETKQPSRGSITRTSPQPWARWQTRDHLRTLRSHRRRVR